MRSLIAFFCLVSAVSANDYNLKVTEAVCEAQSAMFDAAQLPTLTPYPFYEWMRMNAVQDAKSAVYTADLASMWGNNADGWFSAWLFAQFPYDYEEATEAKINYDESRNKCIMYCDRAITLARVSKNQTQSAWSLLK